MTIEGFRCDICGGMRERNYSPKSYSFGKTDLIKTARKEGWSVGKLIKCPSCRKRGAKEND